MAGTAWPHRVDPVLLNPLLDRFDKVMQPPGVILWPVGAGHVLKNKVGRRCTVQGHAPDQVLDEGTGVEECLRSVHGLTIISLIRRREMTDIRADASQSAIGLVRPVRTVELNTHRRGVRRQRRVPALPLAVAGRAGGSGPRSGMYSNQRFTNWSPHDPHWSEAQGLPLRMRPKVAIPRDGEGSLGVFERPLASGFIRPWTVDDVVDVLTRVPNLGSIWWADGSAGTPLPPASMGRRRGGEGSLIRPTLAQLASAAPPIRPWWGRSPSTPG